MEKPISLIIDETRRSLISICNNSGLPTFILEPMVKDIYQEIKLLANEQLKQDTEEYNNSLVEEQNTENMEGESNN